jgi:hypothetical protein
VRLALLFILVCVFVFGLFLSSLVWFFPWLPEEELTLLFLLHHENGDFSILMKDILLITFDLQCIDVTIVAGACIQYFSKDGGSLVARRFDGNEAILSQLF